MAARWSAGSAQGQPTQIATSRATLADPSLIGGTGYGLMYGVICSEWVPFHQNWKTAKKPSPFRKLSMSIFRQATQVDSRALAVTGKSLE